jgi:heme/copper-type cytochrome/quinol oxidase subunit 3
MEDAMPFKKIPGSALRRGDGVRRGEVIDLKRAKAPPRDDVTAWLGMVIFLGSWAMMFAALFFSYGLVRAHAPSWPPLDQPALPLLVPALNTVVIGLSSAALVAAMRALRAGRRQTPARWIALAASLGAVFLVLQALVWARLLALGLVPSGGPFPSVFYALTAFHAVHVLVGLVALVWLARRAAAHSASILSVRLWTMYWHFVGFVWVVLYATVYVL